MVQIKKVEGAGADSAATNGGQVFYVHGNFFGTNENSTGRLIVAYGPASTSKYIAGMPPLAWFARRLSGSVVPGM